MRKMKHMLLCQHLPQFFIRPRPDLYLDPCLYFPLVGLQFMQFAPLGDQKGQQCEWRHLVVKAKVAPALANL